MKKILFILSLSLGVFITSCGDAADGVGEKAGERANENSTSGSGTGTTVGAGVNELEEDTSGRDGNFHPKVKGGSTPADGEGNSWSKEKSE